MKYTIALAIIASVLNFSCSTKKTTAAKINPDQNGTGLTQPQPSAFENEADAVLARANLELDKIAGLKGDDLNFYNTVWAYDDLITDVSNFLAYLSLTKETHPDKEIRDAATVQYDRILAWSVDASARKDIYEKFKALADTNPQIVGEDQRLFDELMSGLAGQGFELSDEDFAELKQLKKDLGTLKTKFAENAKTQGQVAFTLSAEDVATLPEDEQKKLSLEADGSVKLRPGIVTDVIPFLKYSTSEEVRKTVLEKRRSYGGQANADIAEEIIAKRIRIAELLGFDSWADYKVQSTGLNLWYYTSRMAESASVARTFIESTAQKLRPKFEAEVAALTALKQADENSTPDATLEAWDVSYYADKYKKEKFDFDEKVAEEYFDYETVLNGMFKVYEGVFGIQIAHIGPPARNWHPEVTGVEIREGATGKPLGRIYLDMFPREGKRGHFAHFTLRLAKTYRDGRRQSPVSVLVCNFGKDTDGKPANLSFSRVETLFHEFGHGLYNVLSEAKYGRFAGNNVPRDYVEAPSQMLEYFLQDPAVMAQIAFKIVENDDGEMERVEFPSELLDKILASRKATIGLHYTRQFALGLMDLRTYMDITAEQIADPEFSIIKYTNDILAEVYMTYPENSSFASGFTHIFSNAYDAGYYGYAWADVISADLASGFKKADGSFAFTDPVLGQRLRQEMYSQGNKRDASESVASFLGRPYQNDAFINDLLGEQAPLDAGPNDGEIPAVGLPGDPPADSQDF